MAKSAATLRVTLSDGSLDATIPCGTLAWTLLVAATAKREAINEHRAGKLVIGANMHGGYDIHLHGDVDTLLFSTSDTP